MRHFIKYAGKAWVCVPSSASTLRTCILYTFKMTHFALKFWNILQAILVNNWWLGLQTNWAVRGSARKWLGSWCEQTSSSWGVWLVYQTSWTRVCPSSAWVGLRAHNIRIYLYTACFIVFLYISTCTSWLHSWQRTCSLSWYKSRGTCAMQMAKKRFCRGMNSSHKCICSMRDE